MLRSNRTWITTALLAAALLAPAGPSVSQEQQFFDWGQGPSWYREQAAAGNAEAQYRLAVITERGIGVAQDLAAARRWYEAAAEQGHATAQFRIAGMLHPVAAERPT